jgi:hypothetical protein
MKVLQFFSIISTVAIIGCNSPKEYLVNHFTSSCDTIILTTEKMKGYDIFPMDAGVLHFFDTTEFYKYQVKFPGNISNIKISYKIIDFKKFSYEAFHNKALWDDLSLKNNSVCVMSGRRGNDTVFVLDENNNKDFSDDSVRLYKNMDWKTTTKLIKSKYFVNNGKEIVEDSTWVNIGTIDGTELWFFVSNHLESSFSIDGNPYQIGIVDKQSQYCFDEPILSLISQNGIRKDTLLETELLKKGEYLKLEDNYYRFDTISNDGKYITLIKEKDFNSKIGTQVGMISPDFNCHSITGDSISSINYRGKYLLIINVSACWSKISSYKCYKDLTEAYEGKFEFIGIDNSPVTLDNNIRNLNLKGSFVIAENNPVLQKAFRPAYCSRTCFLINPAGRIIDKFEIFDWESSLTRIFGNKK